MAWVTIRHSITGHVWQCPAGAVAHRLAKGWVIEQPAPSGDEPVTEAVSGRKPKGSK